MSKYFIIYGDKTNLDYNLYITSRPVKPSTEMQYEEIEIPGGETLYREKYYKDIEITIPFNFASKSPNAWENEFRNIKRWLNSKAETIKFSDDLEAFYKVKKVKIDTPERVIKKVGKFNVIFTCSPYVYFTDGACERNLTNNLYNDNYIAQPIYRVVGEGLLKLNVNSKEVTINVGQELIINTELGLCFRNGISSNISLKGNYNDLFLKEGDNTFSWNGNFKIYITPNWRCKS